MLNRAIRLFNTIKFLKIKQINYRLYYLIRGKFRGVMGSKPILFKKSKSVELELQNSIHIIDSYLGDKKFKFLNLSVDFKEIDWNYGNHGKLWTYNLNYFDFLSEENNPDKLELIVSFIDNSSKNKYGLEPFPISLRGINWIKYLSYQKIQNQKIDDSLYAQYYILVDNLEYHLLGNHLLENGFSLLFGAYYFEDEILYHKSKEILEEQLEEQILDDGGHFELSPMYHQIMLFRLLDTINLVKNSRWKERELLEFLKIKAELMLGWLERISYKNGDIPLFNDSTNDVAPRTEQLISYATDLGLTITSIELKESGYRKIERKNYELVVDVGHIGASYIAGHAHADTFNFELKIEGKPFIVDIGLSTYETCERRDFERSTNAHNTVEVNGKNQSEVWGSFRVANRANIINLKEGDDFIEATHDGYNPVLHTRRWSFYEDKIVIEDEFNANHDGVARLYFHPNIDKDEIIKRVEIKDFQWSIKECFYALSFNNLSKSNFLEVKFNEKLNICIGK